MDDAHQVGLAEADAQRRRGRALRADRSRVEGHALAVTTGASDAALTLVGFGAIDRLPVIQPPPPACRRRARQRAPARTTRRRARPPWHWVGFGTVAIFAAWLPLAYVAGAVVATRARVALRARLPARSDRARARAMPAGERARSWRCVALPNVLALALAAFAGGFLVGRFGRAPGREAARPRVARRWPRSASSRRGRDGAASGRVAGPVVVAVGFARRGGRSASRMRGRDLERAACGAARRSASGGGTSGGAPCYPDGRCSACAPRPTPRGRRKRCSDLDAVLVDHAHCEMKAATNALSLVVRHPATSRSCARSTDLAREELDHFRASSRSSSAAGSRLGPPPVDAYAAELRRAMSALPHADVPLARRSSARRRAHRGALVRAVQAAPRGAPRQTSPELRVVLRGALRLRGASLPHYVDLAVEPLRSAGARRGERDVESRRCRRASPCSPSAEGRSCALSPRTRPRDRRTADPRMTRSSSRRSIATSPAAGRVEQLRAWLALGDGSTHATRAKARAFPRSPASATSPGKRRTARSSSSSRRILDVPLRDGLLRWVHELLQARVGHDLARRRRRARARARRAPDPRRDPAARRRRERRPRASGVGEDASTPIGAIGPLADVSPRRRARWSRRPTSRGRGRARARRRARAPVAAVRKERRERASRSRGGSASRTRSRSRPRARASSRRSPGAPRRDRAARRRAAGLQRGAARATDGEGRGDAASARDLAPRARRAARAGPRISARAGSTRSSRRSRRAASTLGALPRAARRRDVPARRRRLGLRVGGRPARRARCRSRSRAIRTRPTRYRFGFAIATVVAEPRFPAARARAAARGRRGAGARARRDVALRLRAARRRARSSPHEARLDADRLRGADGARLRRAAPRGAARCVARLRIAGARRRRCSALARPPRVRARPRRSLRRGLVRQSARRARTSRASPAAPRSTASRRPTRRLGRVARAFEEALG